MHRKLEVDLWDYPKYRHTFKNHEKQHFVFLLLYPSKIPFNGRDEMLVQKISTVESYYYTTFSKFKSRYRRQFKMSNAFF